MGSKVWKRGEAICLSSLQATSKVTGGIVVDRHVGIDLLATYETRSKTLRDKLGFSPEEAGVEALELVTSCLKRHESTKTVPAPTVEFLAEVDEFNRTAGGKNPILKEQSSTGVGEWAGYTCNIGKGCSHGCLYCYAEKMATRFKRVEGAEEWQEEIFREVSTAGCKKYPSTVMFPTTHDISPAYLPAYRVHLYNLLNAGNQVLIVTKPHFESVQAICAEFASFRDQMIFRFTIGGLNGEVMRHWEPGAPPIEERLLCLKHAFEQGYTTSVSAEPMLGGQKEAIKLYYLLEPFTTKEIWFGKMNNIGGFRKSADPEVAGQAKELMGLQSDDEIMELVEALRGRPKVQWKDSIKEVIAKRNR
ncbi:radical SAM domain-containing protein [Geoanaerobacter pelophilus]|uniref:Radical SAM domain-containing protein n=2 Tax=Geoanaerobacter pelophilus TaxID=60036 RepID=A0ABQ0MR34_9BACT|nr:radical SAM domain-containing protein [Geoanaerobacter pelophilus]